MLRLTVVIGRPAKEYTGHAADFMEAALPGPLYSERPAQKHPVDGERDTMGRPGTSLAAAGRQRPDAPHATVARNRATRKAIGADRI